MNGTAKAGLALSIIGIVLSITVYTFYIVSFVSSGEFDNVLRGMNIIIITARMITTTTMTAMIIWMTFCAVTRMGRDRAAL